MTTRTPDLPCHARPARADRAQGARGARVQAGVLVAACGLFCGLAGCSSPLLDSVDRDLRRSVRVSAERELAEAAERADPIRLSREDRVKGLGLKPEVLNQLGQIAGPDSYRGKLPPLGVTLYGDEQQTVGLSLRQAIMTAVGNNLNVEFARLGPAVNQSQVAAAEAAFDWTFFVNSQYQQVDQPRTNQSVGGFVSGVNRDRRDVWDTTAGLRKPMISGGQLSLQTEYQYTDNKTPGLAVNPNPAYESNLVIQLSQPLLRNFGSAVQLANVRQARNRELDSIQQLKGTLIQTVTDVETAYWNLYQAQSDLQIVHRLLERGEETLKVLESRAGFDARPENLSNARAAVESRRADFADAQDVLRKASLNLKRLMNDPRLPVGGEVQILPSDAPVDQGVEFSKFDAMKSAIENRPEVQRAILSIDDTSIRQTVADNARLPRLDLQGSSRFSGLGGTVGQSYDQLGESDRVDYQVGVQFEQPIGNRAAEATYSQRRLEKQQAVISYRNTIQGIESEVVQALQDIQRGYERVEQRRSARVAAAEDLRRLLVSEETLQSITPEFLNVKLQRQQALAAAEQQEVTAVVQYNTAVARYYSTTGTALSRNQIIFDVPSLTLERRTSELFPDWPTEKQRERELRPAR